MNNDQNIGSSLTVFYDGWCKLCTGVVGLLLKTKAGKSLEYVPLQSINSYFNSDTISPNLDSINGDEIVVYDGSSFTGGAKGALLILKKFGGGYKFMYWFLNLLPSSYLDRLYRFVATNRYRWFGKKETCSLN